MNLKVALTSQDFTARKKTSQSFTNYNSAINLSNSDAFPFLPKILS